CFEMHRSESWRGGQQNDIHSAVDHFLVGIKTNEARLWSYFHFITMIFLQRLQAILQLRLEGIAHRRQHHVFVGGECLAGCARATPATADEANFEGVRIFLAEKSSGQDRWSRQRGPEQG